jgi:redox-sensitive bicupin YhaK (pirin superfamily)
MRRRDANQIAKSRRELAVDGFEDALGKASTLYFFGIPNPNAKAIRLTKLMIELRQARERGHFDHGWLNTFHTFSFADYYDPKHVQFKTLRVLNEDYVQAGRGFGMHPHRDMEIITYVLDGEITHQDSMGNGSTIRRGDVQRMTAGTGVLHSEFNKGRELLHLLQIWIIPEKRGLQPSYEQKNYPDSEKLGHLRLIASRDGRQDSIVINQDASVYAAFVKQRRSIAHQFARGRAGWVQIVRGGVDMNGLELSAGDGVAVSDEDEIDLQGAAPESELLLFDLA